MSAIILDVPQGSAEWLEARRSHVGASEIGALAGLSPFATPGDVWASKVGPPRPRSKADLHRRVGHLLEGLSRDLWSEHTGVVSAQGPVIASGRLLASLDHISALREPVDGKVVTGGNPHRHLFSDTTIPLAIELQLVQQAHLVELWTGSRLEAAHAAVILVGAFGFEFRPYRVPLTAERRELFATLAYEDLPPWWAWYVEGRRPPPDTEIQDVAAAVDLDTVVRRPATDDEIALIAAWSAAEAVVRDARKVLAEAEKERDVPKQRLSVSIGPDCSIPGAEWRRHGKNVLLKLKE